MTKTQQKALLFVPVIVISSYVVHSLVIDGSQALFYLLYWHPQRPKPKPVAPSPKVVPKVAAAVPPPAAKQATAPAAPTAVTAPVPSEFTKLVGIWRGHVVLLGRGECDLRFELRPKDLGKFVGYSSFTCVAAGPLVTKANSGTTILNRTNPEAAILSGVIEKESIRFTVDKVVGADSNGCAPSSFSLTPFGQDRLAADWEEPGCTGGHLVLGRVIR
jgi:hypothetical protein